MSRLFALLLLLALGSWYGMGQAQAACSPSGTTAVNHACANMTEAAAMARSVASANFSQAFWSARCAGTYTGYQFKLWPTSIELQMTGSGGCGGLWGGLVMTFPSESCPSGSTFNTRTANCDAPCSTGAIPQIATVSCPAGDPSRPRENCGNSVCVSGCSYTATTADVVPFAIDGVQYSTSLNWTPTGTSCSAGGGNSPVTPPADSDGDGVSDGNDGAPNNPGSKGGGLGGDSDGDGNPDGADCGVAGKPACDNTKPNSNKSSGGGDCKTPPQTTGDEALAQIAFQTWATRCAVTDVANKAGSGTGTGGVGTVGGTNMKPTNDLLTDIRDKLTGGDDMTDKSEGTSDQLGRVQSDLWGDGTGGPNPDDIDMSGFGYARACPAPLTITIAGYTKTIGDGSQCDVFQLFGALVLAAAAAQAAFIFAGKNA